MIDLYKKLEYIAKTEYKDIIKVCDLIGKKTAGSSKLRIFLKDHSFLDVWLSKNGKYSYHWEQRAQRGKIYRHDNAPDFPQIKTYPKHLHDGTETNVTTSTISGNPQTAIRQILIYIKKNIS